MIDMTREDHIQRHRELHRALDELLADFIRYTKGSVLNRPISDLISWSYQQTIDPTEDLPR